MAPPQQESWTLQLEASARTGMQALFQGWETASTLLQEQVDVLNPGSMSCTACQRACENSQLVMPQVMAEDEVNAYRNADMVQSPFSPMKTKAPSSNVLKLHISPAKRIAPQASPHNEVFTFSEDKAAPIQEVTEVFTFSDEKAASIPEVTPEVTSPAKQEIVAEESKECLGHMPEPGSMGNFGYYHEYEPVLRPPTSICSTNVMTSVRAAPWASWMKPAPAKSPNAKATSASCQTGSSLVSKGGVGTSQVASILQNLPTPCANNLAKPLYQETSEFAPLSQVQAPAPSIAAPEVSQEAAFVAAAQIRAAAAAHEAAAAQQAALVQQAAQLAATQQEAAATAQREQAAAEFAAAQHAAAVAQQVAQKPMEAPMQDVTPAPTQTKPKSATKSVLSQSTALKSSSATALSAAFASDRKSALSMSVPMNSSASMALGGLSKSNARRRGGSAERSESVVNLNDAGPEKVSDRSATPDASVASAAPKLAKPRGSRSKGPDAKSVISNMNSSSSASVLLGPMMQGQNKKRSAKPKGADVASII